MIGRECAKGNNTNTIYYVANPYDVTDPLKEGYSLYEDVLNFLFKSMTYINMNVVNITLFFLDSFKHIQKIDISISIDPEIQDCQHRSLYTFH